MTRRARTGERGAAVVDFVLVLLVLLPLVLGILQLALVLHVRNTLASAAAEGARHAAVAGSSAPAGQAKVQDLVDGALSQDFVRSVSVHPALVGGAPGYEAVVEAEVTVLGLGGTGVRVRVEGHAVAEQGVVRREAPRRDGLGAGRVQLAGDHPHRPAHLDRHLRLRGAAGCLRHQRRGASRRPGVRPRARRRDRRGPCAGRRRAGPRRPGHAGPAGPGRDHLRGARRQLPRRHLGHHGRRGLRRRPAVLPRHPRQGRGELLPRRDPHGADRPVRRERAGGRREAPIGGATESRAR